MLHSDETVERVLKLLPNARAELLAGKGHVLIGQKAKIAQFLISAINIRNGKKDNSGKTA